MISKIISLGDKIELKRTGVDTKSDKLGKEPVITYVSQVYDILSEDEMKIAMPILEGKIIPLPVNGRYDLCFYTSNGLYQCRATITDRYKEDSLYVLQIEITSDLKKFQRRQYFRLQCTMDIRYKVLSKEEIISIVSDKDRLNEFLQAEMDSGVALDISGGGIRFTSKLQHNPGDCVMVILKMQQGKEYESCALSGTILSSNHVLHRSDIFEHRVEYSHLQGNVRENLIKFIFEEERRMRQKEKI